VLVHDWALKNSSQSPTATSGCKLTKLIQENLQICYAVSLHCPFTTQHYTKLEGFDSQSKGFKISTIIYSLYLYLFLPLNTASEQSRRGNAPSVRKHLAIETTRITPMTKKMSYKHKYGSICAKCANENLEVVTEQRQKDETLQRLGRDRTFELRALGAYSSGVVAASQGLSPAEDRRGCRARIKWFGRRYLRYKRSRVTRVRSWEYLGKLGRLGLFNSS
jgi:hypothetical protein